MWYVAHEDLKYKSGVFRRFFHPSDLRNWLQDFGTLVAGFDGFMAKSPNITKTELILRKVLYLGFPDMDINGSMTKSLRALSDQNLI